MASDKDTKHTRITISGEVEEDIPVKKNNSKEKMGLPAQYLDLGLYLALPLVIAVFLGQYLDRKFHTQALFTISLLIFGTISVFYNLYKLYSEDDSHKRGNS